MVLHSPAARSVATFSACFAILLTVSIMAAGGRLIFTLDDPYIHLAVAETLLKGGYGINVEEPSSPSSSAIYPFLLALGLLAGHGDASPIVWNVIPMAATAVMLLSCLQRYAVQDGAGHWAIKELPLTLLALLSVNAIALPMTGMEHALHMMFSALIVAGLIVVAETQRAPAWLVAAIILNPLLRFEGLALSAAAAFALIYAGFWVRGLVAGAGALAGVAAFALFLVSLGLPPVPSSVLLKSKITRDLSGGAAPDLLGAIASGGFKHEQLVLIGMCLLCIAAMFNREPAKRKKRIIVGGAAAAALLGHLVAGQYDWFGRYEVYAVCFGLMALAYVYADALAGLARLQRLAIVLSALFVAGTPYWSVTIRTPSAVRNVHGQQQQMHRFATDFFPHPVAVNDLGWVSYKNETFVLDLVGLGSNEARRLRQAGGLDKVAIARLAAERGVVFAMIYDTWFPKGMPETWCRVGQLTTSEVMMTERVVAFYLIDRAKAHEMSAALDRFAADLPPGAAFEKAPDCS